MKISNEYLKFGKRSHSIGEQNVTTDIGY